MLEAYNYLISATGFHEFAEFTAEDVGTVDSGLNSIVAASNNEMALFPIKPIWSNFIFDMFRLYLYVLQF